MNYPLITWQVLAPQFTTSSGTHGGSLAYGYGFSGASTPPADTIAYLVYDALDNAGATLLTVQYTVDNTTGPSLAPAAIYYEYDSASPIVFNFSSLADAAVYGFNSTTVTFPASTSGAQFGVTPYNVGGLWAPSGVSGNLVRELSQRAAASSSDMSGLSTDVVNWGQIADIELRSTLFPAANAFTWYASQSVYATKAQRSVNDPNNILEKMLAAAATGVTFRLYQQESTTAGLTSTDYLVARMPTIAAKNSAKDFLQADDEPRLWSVAGMFFRGET
jgi:hypothetical protein